MMLKKLLTAVRDAAKAGSLWGLISALGDLMKFVGEEPAGVPEGAQAATGQIGGHEAVSIMNAVCDAPDGPDDAQRGLLDGLLGGVKIKDFLLALAKKLIGDLLAG